MDIAKALQAAKGLTFGVLALGVVIYILSQGFTYLTLENDAVGSLAEEVHQLRESSNVHFGVQGQHFTRLEDSLDELVTISRVNCLAHANGSAEYRLACEGVGFGQRAAR